MAVAGDDLIKEVDLVDCLLLPCSPPVVLELLESSLKNEYATSQMTFLTLLDNFLKFVIEEISHVSSHEGT
jgi:hypothetical protein